MEVNSTLLRKFVEGDPETMYGPMKKLVVHRRDFTIGDVQGVDESVSVLLIAETDKAYMVNKDRDILVINREMFYQVESAFIEDANIIKVIEHLPSGDNLTLHDIAPPWGIN